MPSSSLLSLDGLAIVIDCGLGVSRGLVDQGVALKDLSLIFITHLHSDHYLELGPLLYTAWAAGLKTPVTVYGPVGLQDYWQAFLLSMTADIDLRVADEGRPDIAKLVIVNTIHEGVFFNANGLTVAALKNNHPPLVETFALSFKTAAQHVVMSGDTAYCPALAEFARGADLLVHEAMLEAALPALFKRIGNTDDRLMQHWLRAHSLASEAAKTAADAGVGALALNALIPSDDPTYTADHWYEAVKAEWTGQFYLGKDGLRIDL